MPVSGVSPHIEGMANPGKFSTGPRTQVNDGSGAIASGWSMGQMLPGELAMVGSLRDLGLRIDRLRVRLSGLDTAAQLAAGRTSRSTRDSWRPFRVRSDALLGQR